jgi:RNA polymerase sigma factor (sigma-70 family)
MDCIEITNSQKLVAYFRENNEIQLNIIFKCFFRLFYEDFRRLTYKYCLSKFHTKNKEEELASDAFNDGLMSFYYKLKKDGFEEKGAQVKTAFFSFCLFKLKGLTKTLERRFEKETPIDPLVSFNGEKEFNTDVNMTDILSYQILLNKEEEILNRALTELGERGTHLVVWKKVLKLSNEEIAARIGIQPDSVPNEVFKSFRKLKDIVERLQGKNN